MQKNPDNIEHGSLQLGTKRADLHYSYLSGDSTSKTLVVFLNGLIMPKSSWIETLRQTNTKTQLLGLEQPHLLAYDRFGQGLSAPDPAGDHDVLDAARDLRAFLSDFANDYLPFEPAKIVFVCNSIGCAIARVFAAEFPGIAAGFVFLDSVMANSDFVSIFPDPDDAGFEEQSLPEGTTVDELRIVREEYRRKFHPSVPNPEGLDRQTLKALLPESDSPELKGLDGVAPLVTVVGHDWDRFADENVKSFGIPKALIMAYVNPIWHEYNQGLVRLTDSDKSKGPIIAEGCAHFIQKDDPAFVADLICEMLQQLQS